MKNSEKFIDAYEIYYKDMLNSNIYSRHRLNGGSNDKNIAAKKTLESKKEDYDSSAGID